MPSRYTLGIITVLCVAMMFLTFFTDMVNGPLSYVAAYTIVPFERGFYNIGEAFSKRMDELKNLREVLAEVESLQKRVDELTQQNSELTRDRYELGELRQLYDLSDQLSNYDTVGARVIGKDPGNWFSVFLIDKGEEDGIKVDMNVMTGSGIVGIITEVGPNWATVRSIIDDASNVSAMVLSTSDVLVVNGDLKLMNEGVIRFEHLADEEDQVIVGDQVVTSNISDKFLPGLNIGYINSIETDPNNLTRSGTLTPSVDFKHINTVLVIKELKEGKSETKNN